MRGHGVLDYDQLAGSYDELYGEEQRTKYLTVLPLLGKVDLCLDVGCGTGLLIRTFPRFSRFYVGVDTSHGMIQRARTLVSSPSSQFVVADAHRLPLRNRAFQAVFLFTILHEVNPDRVLEEVFRVAGEGCRVVLSVLKKNELLASRVDEACEKNGVRILERLEGEGLLDLIFLCSA